MGVPVTETKEVQEQMEEVKEQIKEVMYTPPWSRVHDGSSSSTSPKPLPRCLPKPTPRSVLPTPEPSPRPLPMHSPPIFPGHVFAPLQLLFFISAPGCLLARVPLPEAWPLLYFMHVHPHRLSSALRQGPLRQRASMTASANLHPRVPRQEPLPPRLPMPAPALLRARVPTQAVRNKFVQDLEVAGKKRQLYTLVQDWLVNRSYPDLIRSVEKLFEGHPDLVVTFNKFLTEAHRYIVPESVKE